MKDDSKFASENPVIWQSNLYVEIMNLLSLASYFLSLLSLVSECSDSSMMLNIGITPTIGGESTVTFLLGVQNENVNC